MKSEVSNRALSLGFHLGGVHQAFRNGIKGGGGGRSSNQWRVKQTLQGDNNSRSNMQSCEGVDRNRVMHHIRYHGGGETCSEKESLHT